MTSSMGGYKYESPTTRTLGTITPESYDYRDQGKVITKLVTDVSFMAGLQRKMQKGIDDANQNFVQQIQSFITDFLVILGGQGDTGFDWGDLKYIFQAIGALFGLNPGMPFPINLLQAAWHFFSNYILPIGDFGEAIDNLTDMFIATVLDIFGEVPIVGQALEQLAVILVNARDGLESLGARFYAFITNITDGLGEGIDFLGHIIQKIYSTFIQPIIDFISRAVGGPIGGAISSIFNNIAKIFGLASGADSKATLMLKKTSPLWETVDGNGETSVALATCDTIMTINSTNSRGAFISCRGGDVKQTISFIAYKTGTVSTFYIDIYKFNGSNGADKVYTTPDLSSSIVSGSGNQTVVFFTMDAADAYNTDINSKYLLIARMTGSGSVGIQGAVFPVATTSTRPLYPGILRNPTTTPAPSNFLATELDAIYVKETPYFQTGTLDDITPQSYFTDFSSLTTNLWYFKQLYITGFGSVAKLAVNSNGELYMPSGGPDGYSSIIHKFNTATNQCRVGWRISQKVQTSPLYVYLFAKLDLSSYVRINLRRITNATGLPGVNIAVLADLEVCTGLNSVSYTQNLMYQHILYETSDNDGFVNSWFYLEYDPTDGSYYLLMDPDFTKPGYRSTQFGIVDGASCFGKYTGGSNTTVDNVDKSSVARYGGVIMRQMTGGVRSCRVDDWILQDYAAS